MHTSRVVAHQEGAAVVDIGRDPFDLGPILVDATHPTEIGMATPFLQAHRGSADQEIVIDRLAAKKSTSNLARSQACPSARRSDVAPWARSGKNSWPFTFKPMPTTTWRTSSPLVAISVRMPAALRNSPASGTSRSLGQRRRGVTPAAASVRARAAPASRVRGATWRASRAGRSSRERYRF